MTVGDRRHPEAQPVLRSAHYPEALARADVVSESLRASYSYTQHAAAHVASWASPQYVGRLEWARISGGFAGTTYTALDVETVIPAHWDRLRVVVWCYAVEFLRAIPLDLRVTLDGQTADAELDLETPPVARILGQDLRRIEAELGLLSVTRDTTLRLTAELARDISAPLETRVAVYAAHAWAQTDGEQ